MQPSKKKGGGSAGEGSQPLVPAPYQLSGSVTHYLVKVTKVHCLWSPPSTQKNLSRLIAGGPAIFSDRVSY